MQLNIICSIEIFRFLNEHLEAILTTAFGAFIAWFFQLWLTKYKNKYTLQSEYRKKKFEALEELNAIVSSAFHDFKIIDFPQSECSAKDLNNNLNIIKITSPVLEDLNTTTNLALELTEFCFKNQSWIDSFLLKDIQTYIAYLNNYSYYCKRNKLLPNKLTSSLLRDDTNNLINDIFLDIKKSYFTSIRKKILFKTKVNSKLSIALFQRRTKNLKLMYLIGYAELENRENLDSIEYMKKSIEKSNKKDAYKMESILHANYCKNCTLNCELAGLHFLHIHNP